MIAAAEVKYAPELSDALVDMLRRVLEKDPSKRAGVGDCLQHQYCKSAREQRIKELGEGVETHEEVIVKHEDLRHAITKKSSLRDLADRVSRRFSTLKNRALQKSMSLDVDGSSEGTGTGRSTPRTSVTTPFTFWRSQKTMSMDDGSTEGEIGTNTQRRGPLPGFWRSTGHIH